MRLLAHLFVPGQHNNHHPHLIRFSGLNVVLYVLLASTFISSTLNPFGGRVLAFATEINSTQIIDLTNKERQASGLTELKNNPQLALAAQEKANYMFEKNFWAHNAPDGTTPWFFIEKNSYQYSAAGENLARDFYTSGAVVSAWMASPGHRANILNGNYAEIGIAVVNGKLDGKETTLVVQMFGQTLNAAVDKPTSQGSSISRAGSTPTEVVKASPTPAVTPIEVTQELVLPTANRPNSGLINSYLPNTSFVQSSLLTLLSSLTTVQKIYLTLLMLLIATFAFDAFLLYRRRLFRFSSHSFTHLLTLMIAITSVVFSGQGYVG